MEYTMFAAALVCAVLPFSAGLECYTCTDLKIETDNDQVNALLSGQIPRDMACGDDDISGIKLETCPDGGPGQIAKCTKSKGEATASAFGQSITVTTTARSCTSVAAETKDICQTNTDESALKNVPGMQGVDVDDFEATTCICGADNCNGQTAISPAIATCLLSLALAVYALW